MFKLRYPAAILAVCSAALFALCSASYAQDVIVTAEGHHGAPPSIAIKDLTVSVAEHPALAEGWTSLRYAGLELYVVVDEGLDTRVGIQFESLKSFITGQPNTTRVGLAYLRNGSAIIASPLTATHEETAAALRLPLGDPEVVGSPYVAISDLIKKWHQGSARREMLVISSGIDPYAPADPRNPYVEKTIADAQRAGVVVHSIDYTGAGRLGHNRTFAGWGQNYLSSLGEATGGAAYWPGRGGSVLFDSYLNDLNARLRNQYLLTLTPADLKPRLEALRIKSSDPAVSLVAPKQIWLAHQPD